MKTIRAFKNGIPVYLKGNNIKINIDNMVIIDNVTHICDVDKSINFTRGGKWKKNMLKQFLI